MVPLEQRIAENGALIVGVFSVLFVAGVMADITLYRRFRDGRHDLAGSLFRVTWRPWEGIDSILVILLTVACALLAGKLGGAIHRIAGAHADLAELAWHSLMVHGVILASIELLRRTRRLSLHGAFGGSLARLGRDIGEGALYFLALIPPLLALAYVNSRLLELFGIDPKMQPLLTEYADADSLLVRCYIAGWAILVAPLAEECLFRGLALPALLKRVAPVTAVLVVSTVFAAIHFHPPAFLPLLGLSVALCVAYLSTESLTVPVTMHALFNGTTTTLVLLAS